MRRFTHPEKESHDRDKGHKVKENLENDSTRRVATTTNNTTRTRRTIMIGKKGDNCDKKDDNADHKD